MTRIGSLFSGYGGLDLAAAAALGGTIAWHSENNPAASAVLAARFPGVPNLGDIARVNWPAVEPVDVLCGGFPCQDLSLAGVRQGLQPGTRSGLWAHMAYAIDQLRPPLVVIENVRGLLSAPATHPAHGRVELCPWCLADDDPDALRALGAVLGDLADLGYDARWEGLSAAAVGAPHSRFRVFLVAWPAANPAHDDSDGGAAAGAAGRRAGSAARHPAHLLGERGRPLGGEPPWHPGAPGGPGRGAAADADSAASGQWGQPAPGQAPRGRARPDVGRRGGVSAADTLGGGRARRAPDPLRRPLAGAAAAWRGEGGSGGHAAADPAGAGLPDRGALLQPADEGRRAAPQRRGGAAVEWGPYGPAVARWEQLTRPAPPPTAASGRGGAGRLAPAFVEWLMGLPEGWVTAVPGLTRAQQLTVLGNGVVPQQAEAALRLLLG